MLLFLVAVSANAATYYVSPSGNDGNPGTLANPWKTIARASPALTAGDIVHLRAGTYAEQVVPQRSGSPGAWITYAAYPGETPTIDGASVVLGGDTGLVEIVGRSYIAVTGLRIINAGPDNKAAGIWVDDSHHIVIERNSTFNTRSSGIGVWGSRDVTIRHNDIRLCCNDGQQECLTVASTDGFEIAWNVVTDGGPGTNGGEGLDVKDGSRNGAVHHNDVSKMNRVGIYVDAWDKHTRDIDFYQNVVHDIPAGDGIAVTSEMGGLVENIRIENNLVYNNGGNGFTLGHWGGPVPTRPVRNLKVVNNTFYNNGGRHWGGGISIENRDARDVTLRNNLLCDNFQFTINVEVTIPNLVIDSNLLDGYRGYATEARGINAIEAAAQMVDARSADFHLLPTSPAIDRGSAAEAPAIDFHGIPRPQGKGIDIGACEFAATPPRRRATRP